MKRNAIRNPNKVMIFTPRITSSGNIYENLRILGKAPKRSYYQASRDTPQVDPEDIVVHTDESCIRNGKINAHTGIGVWFGPGDPHNIAAPVGQNIPQTNNSAEILAIHKALTAVPSSS